MLSKKKERSNIFIWQIHMKNVNHSKTQSENNNNKILIEKDHNKHEGIKISISLASEELWPCRFYKFWILFFFVSFEKWNVQVIKSLKILAFYSRLFDELRKQYIELEIILFFEKFCKFKKTKELNVLNL